MHSSQHVTAARAADRLGVSRRAVLSMIQKGQLPAEKLEGRTAPYLIDPAAVDRLAAEREQRVTSEEVTR